MSPDNNKAFQTDKSADLGKQAAVSTAWISIANYTGYAINLIVVIPLARILTPADYGVVALAASVMAPLGMLASWGIGTAVVSRKEMDDRFMATAFSLMMLLVGGVFGLAVLFALLWQGREPVAAQILLILAGVQVVSTLGQVPQFLLERAMRFRPIAVLKVLSVIAESGGALICAIFLDLGLWSLVVGRVLGTLTLSIGAWILSPWRPRFGLDRTVVVWYYGFGKKMFVARNLFVLQKSFDDLMLGVFAGDTNLGLYTKSFLLSETIGQTIAPGLGRVSLSTFSSLRDEPERLAGMYANILWVVQRAMIAYAVPVALLAPQLILIVFGDQWLATVPILRFLLIYGGMLPMLQVTRSALIALGLETKLALVSIIQICVFMPVIFIAALTRNPVLVAAAVAYLSIQNWLLMLYYLRQEIKLHVFRDLLPALAAGGLAGFPVWLLLNREIVGESLFASVLVGGLLFVILYIPLLWLLERKRMAGQLEMIFDLFGLQDTALARILLRTK